MVEDAISFWTDIQRYEDMLVSDPDSYCFALLSELYRKLGLLDDAISVAQKGCDRHPDYPNGFFVLGTACYAKGRNVEARQALEQVLALDGEDLAAQKLLGQLYVEAGEVRLAKKVLEQVLRRSPDDTESLLLYRSISSTEVGTEPEDESLELEEESLEHADVIEDLTEVLDDIEELEESDALEDESPFELSARAEAAVESPEIQASDDFDDLWAIEAPQETPARYGAAEKVAAPEDLAGAPAPATTSAVAASEILVSPEAPKVPEARGTVPAQHPSRDPLATATLAELYVSQGFLAKALGVYQELLAADPANLSYRKRCDELQAAREQQQEALQPAAPARPAVQEASSQQASSQRDEPQPAAPALFSKAPASPGVQEAASQEPSVPRDAEAELGFWLENIRRRKDGV